MEKADCATEHHRGCPYEAKLAGKDGAGFSTWAGWAAVVLTLLLALWTLAGTLGEIKARQEATDRNINLILGALHLVPSPPSSAPANVSAQRITAQ